MTIKHSLYREAGKVEIDQSACKACGQCARICPGEVLTFEGGKVRVNENSPFGCIACGHCMMVCPEGSIRVRGRGLSPDDLLPLPSPGKRATADQLAALMRARRSVRHFDPREVEPELLERILEMAASAPMGIPPWDVGCVTVRGRARVRELAAEVVKGYEGFLKLFRPGVLALMRPLVGKAKYELFKDFIRPLGELYVRNHREGRDAVFHDAPAVILFYHSPYADAVDATIACVYAMLAAESLGLGTTMIGGAPPVLKRNKPLCRRLGIPKDNTPAIALIVGYPAIDFRRAIRRSFTSASSVS